MLFTGWEVRITKKNQVVSDGLSNFVCYWVYQSGAAPGTWSVRCCVHAYWLLNRSLLLSLSFSQNSFRSVQRVLIYTIYSRSFVIPRTSLYRGSLYRVSIVYYQTAHLLLFGANWAMSGYFRYHLLISTDLTAIFSWNITFKLTQMVPEIKKVQILHKVLKWQSWCFR